MKEIIGINLSDKQQQQLASITRQLEVLSNCKIDYHSLLPLAYVCDTTDAVQLLNSQLSNTEISFHSLYEYANKCYITVKCNQLPQIYDIIKAKCSDATLLTKQKYSIKMLLSNNYKCGVSIKELSKRINIFNKPSQIKGFCAKPYINNTKINTD